MASEEEQLLTNTRRTTISRWPSFLKLSSLPIASKTRAKRCKISSVRLGGKRRRKGISLVGVLRRLKLRWLRLRYTWMLKKLKALYSSMLKDLMETGATLQQIQKTIMTDTYMTAPVVGLGVSGIPSHVGSRPPHVRK